MWQLAVHPRTYEFIRNAIINDIHRREATLRVLFRLASSGAIRAECIDDSIEIGRLSESICRELILGNEGRDTFSRINKDMTCAVLDMNREYGEKKIWFIDGSPRAEDESDESKAVWSKHRRTLRRIIRKFRFYVGCVHVHLTPQRVMTDVCLGLSALTIFTAVCGAIGCRSTGCCQVSRIFNPN